MMNNEVRAWHVNEALTSFRRLGQIIDELTEDEVRQALSLEASNSTQKVDHDPTRSESKKTF